MLLCEDQAKLGRSAVLEDALLLIFQTFYPAWAETALRAWCAGFGLPRDEVVIDGITIPVRVLLPRWPYARQLGNVCNRPETWCDDCPRAIPSPD